MLRIEKINPVKIFSILLLFLGFHFGAAQSSQGEYLEAKRQFSLGNYRVAMQAFKDLTSDKTFGAYASFYYALSAYKQGDFQLAEDMWKQVLIKHADWDKRSEAAFWLAHLAFEQKNLQKAFSRVEELPTEWQEYLIENTLSSMTLDELNTSYKTNPDNETIAKYYVSALMAQPYDKRDQQALAEVREKFNIQLAGDESLPLIKKEAYSVAVVLPFMFESLSNPKTVIRNEIIFDLYEGMKLGQLELKKMGIDLDLSPFDTKKKGNETRKLIESGKLNNADVIIGPLYAKPNQHISQFSNEQKIAMVNPVSSNGNIVGANHFGHLFKPSYKTQGREAARYVAQKYVDNKKLFIFYETDRDLLVANAYKEAIEEEGFFVERFERLTNEDALQIQRDFTEQYEVRLDTKYSKKEIDSIAAMPGRTVRTKSLRNSSTGRIIRNEEGKEVFASYEVKFKIQQNSIGHIFAATSSNLLANNLISLAEVRSDTIGLIGYDDWLSFSLISYDQLERLQVEFLSPSFIDKDKKSYAKLSKTFIETVGVEPSEYHVYGYELIMQLGQLMNAHGKYFQRGLLNGEAYPGIVMEGLRYGPYQDNQVVPITTLKNLTLVNQNKRQAIKSKNGDSNE